MSDSPSISLRSCLTWERSAWSIALAAAVACRGLSIPLALLVREILHRASEDSATALAIDGGLIGGLCLLVLAQGASQGFATISSEHLAQRIIARLRERIADHLHTVSIGWIERKSPERLFARLSGDMTAIRAAAQKIAVQAPAEGLLIAVVLVLLANMHLGLAAVAALPLGLVAIATALAMKPIRARTRRARAHQTRLLTGLSSALALLPWIKAQGQEGASRARLRTEIQGVAAETCERSRFDAWISGSSAFAAALSLAGVGLVGASLVQEGLASAADVLLALWLAFLLRASTRRLGAAALVGTRSKVSFERVQSLLEHAPEPSSRALVPLELPREALFAPGFDAVTWRDGSGRERIRRFSFAVQGPGVYRLDAALEIGRLVFELLLRLRRPHEGKIRFGPRLQTEVELDAIRKQIGWIDADRRCLDAHQAEPPIELAAAPMPPCLEPDALTLQERSLSYRRGDPLSAAATLELALEHQLARNPPLLLLERPGLGLDDATFERLAQKLAAIGRERLVLIADEDPRWPERGLPMIPSDLEGRPAY